MNPTLGDDGVTRGLTAARVVYLLTRWIWRAGSSRTTTPGRA